MWKYFLNFVPTKKHPFAGSVLAARAHYKQPLWLFIESCKSGIRPKVLL